jgi:sugar lactone lactonase YvrE
MPTTGPRVPRTLALAVFLGALLASPARGEGVKLRPGTSAYADSKGVALARPEGILCTPSAIVAADTGNGRFVVYDVGDRALTPKLEFQVAEVPYPIRIRLDGKGGFFALDGKSRRIVRLGLDGAVKGIVPVDAGGASPIVRSFAVGPDGDLYVLDVAGARVLVMDAAGAPVLQVALPPECRSPSDVAVGPSGRIYVLDGVGSRIFAAAKGETAASPLGASLSEDLAFATSLAADAEGRLFVVDQNGGGIVILGPDGSFRGRQSGMGWTEGLLRWPSSICLDGKGGIAVADRENNRIATFQIAP